MHHPRLIAASAALILLSALPAAAQVASPVAVSVVQGSVESVALQDFDHDGKIDRAVVTFANPSASHWEARGIDGLQVAYQGTPLKLLGGYVAASGDPAQFVAVLDETDPHLPATTATDGFAVTYAPQGPARGVSDGQTELSAIAAGGTILDQAAPVLLASSPAAGSSGNFRDADMTLTFSEPVLHDSLTVSSTQNPDAWGFVVSGGTVTVKHGVYGRGVTETIGFDATDAAGNHVAVGPYPNPFTFRTSSYNDPQPVNDPLFTWTAPQSLGTLTAGAADVLAWYTNESGAAEVRLSYSTDAGQTYAPIATAPVIPGTYVWYPAPTAGAVQFKAEELNAQGAVMNVAFVNPVTIVGQGMPPAAPVLTPPGTQAPPSVPSSGPDVTPPSIVGTVVFDRYDPAARTVRMSWTTDEPTTADVKYGVYLHYGSDAADATLSTSHSVTLAGLTPGALHQARITSTDASGNAAVSSDYALVFLQENDLVKGKASSAVYWFKGGKRYAFPNEDAYRSWFGTDFSRVIALTDNQLAGLPLGGNVKMKEGVYLLKIQSDPKTYAVEPGGALRWIQTEAQAKALYGDAWAKRVRDVDVSFWVDYTIGQPLADGERPAGYAG